ncbi:MAG: hypothetical protein ACP5IE_00760 [Infirmifilum sp.]
MMIVVQRALGAFISPNPLASHDKFAHAVSNALALNSLTGPAFEVKTGELELEFDSKTLVAFAGDSEVYVDGRRVEPWAAYFAKERVTLKTTGRAYISVRGLRGSNRRKQVLKSGEAYPLEQLNGISESDLRALRVPSTLRFANGDWLEAVARIQRHLGMVLEAVRKGAEQVKVRVGGGEFEVWVLELS